MNKSKIFSPAVPWFLAFGATLAFIQSLHALTIVITTEEIQKARRRREIKAAQAKGIFRHAWQRTGEAVKSSLSWWHRQKQTKNFVIRNKIFVIFGSMTRAGGAKPEMTKIFFAWQSGEWIKIVFVMHDNVLTCSLRERVKTLSRDKEDLGGFGQMWQDEKMWQGGSAKCDKRLCHMDHCGAAGENFDEIDKSRCTSIRF